MMDYDCFLSRHYDLNGKLYRILMAHSRSVADKALVIAHRLRDRFAIDLEFLEQAAMLHDIGIIFTDAPDIGCYGTYPYICHGYLGSEWLHRAGYPRHALVCERHTGTGLSLDKIIEKKLPIPHRDMRPQSIEEQVICYADKFFSKTRLTEEMSLPVVRSKLQKHGVSAIQRFDEWTKLFNEE